MADNRYRRYLNDEEKPRHSLLDGITTVGLVLAGAGAAYVGLSHLNDTGLLAKGISKINNKISYMDSFLTGLNKTFGEEGVFKTLLGGAQDALEKNMADSFKTHAVTELREKAGNSLMGTPTRFEKTFSRIGKSRRDIVESSIQGARLDNIMRDVETTGWYQSNPELGGAVKNLLTRDKNILSAGFDRDFRRQVVDSIPRPAPTAEIRQTAIDKAVESAVERTGLKEKFNNDKAWNGVVSDLKSILGKYSDRGEFTRHGGAYRDAVSEQINALNKAFNKQMLEMNTKRTATSNVIQSMFPDYELLTVGKAAQMGVFDYTSIVSKTARGGKITRRMMKPGPLSSIPGLESAIVDPLVFINKSGNIIDMRATKIAGSKTMKTLSDQLQIPLLGIRPFKLLSVFNREALEDIPFHIFKRQNVKSVLNFAGKNLAEDDYYFMFGKMVNRKGEEIASDITLANSKFGVYQREYSRMAGYTRRTAKEPEGFLGHAKQIFDVGNQEYESAFSRKFSGISKFWNKDWERNIWRNLRYSDDEVNTAYLQRAYGKFINTVDNMTSALSSDTLKAFSSHIDSGIYDIMKQGTKEEGTMNAIYKLLQTEQLRDSTRYEFTDILKNYINDPDAFERVIRTAREGYQADLPELLDSFRINTTKPITNLDQAQKLLHMELINRSQDLTKNVTVGKIVKDMLSGGELSQKQADEILNLYVLNDLKNYGVRGQLVSPEGFLGLTRKPLGEAQGTINKQLEEMIYKANPNLGVGPGQPQTSFFPGTEYIPVRKGQVISRTGKMISDINQSIKSGSDVATVVGDVADKLRTWGLDTLGELGFGTKNYRAGRTNLDKVTSTTLKWYHGLFRLDEGLSKIGLGMSTANMGSTQDLAKNLFLRRLLGPLALVSGLAYLNYEAGNVLGEKPNQSLARTYAQMTLDVQGLKDVTGINAIGQGLNRAFPGFNLLSENPIGMALNYGTFGFLGDSRGYSEMKYYYEKGYDPIRKGRFWGVGSNTPFYGDRVSYFAPSWYRLTMGEPQYTDSLYGSEGEYWANTWFPNPRNLFGLQPLLDPYHWERKHKEDRPYPVTGGTAFRDIPIVGPLIDMPLSAVFKPTIKNAGLQRAHEAYLEEINDKYKAFINQANRGAMLQIYPGGRITPVSYTDEGVVFGGDGSGTGVGGGEFIGGALVGGGDGYGGGAVGTTGGAYSTGRGSAMAQSHITYLNQNYVQYANVKPIDGRSVALLRDHAYVDSLDKAADPNSLGYRLGETAYSLTEIGGIYGFMFNTLTGLENRAAPGVELQNSSRMYGLQRRFWDQNLGGLGGELSEIYRRFLPHRRNQIQEYNPLRNKMPDWMPGLDYFTDFKHGDPYVKIPKGEGRLPGPGYEAINKLHSDPIFGRYGALDRFKILADVAPWSEQYRYYDSIITKMRDDGYVSPDEYKDVQRIREMVSERKEKYDLYPYKYRYAGNLEKKTVTIARMLDATTFVTDEMPGSPIRLAGIDLPAQTSEDYQEIIAELSKYLKPGNKVKIGIESDPLIRVNDDTMGTMPAVLYNNWGDPVQAKLARKYKSIKSDYKDNAATTVNSLFEHNTITVGKVWESFAHLDTPLHTKFLKVRSPLEHYKRQMLYGKDWQSWSHPFRDWIGPTVDKLTAGDPLISTAVGAGIGSLFGRTPKAKAIGAIIGGIVGGVPSSIRSAREVIGRISGRSDYTWIPGRRRQEREIEEYFDMLKYVKYKGLYEKAREMAIVNEGLDPDAIINYSETSAGGNSKEKRKLENIKRWLKVYDTGDEESQKSSLKAINTRLTEISGNKMLLNAGPMTMRALQYKAEYEATLYGADPNGDLQVIYRALPKKDRPFFKYFMIASPEEREEILRLVPNNQRRFYQAKWGLQQDKQESVEEYFMSHYLPDASWAGWKPGTSLESVKLKFVQNTAIDIGELGFWEDDIQYAKNAPSIPGLKANVLGTLDVMRLKKVLAGAGIDDADINIVSEVTDRPDNLYNINMNMQYDRRSDVNDAINNNLAAILA